METNSPRELRSYLIGFALAVILTAIPFGLVAFKVNAPLGWIIAACAAGQLLVQLRFFLHLSWRGQKSEDLQLVLFTLFMLFILIGGTLWVLGDLATRM